MKVTVLDDWSNTLRTLPCFGRLDGHEVRIWNDHTQDTDELARRLGDTEALVLFRERTRIDAALLGRLAHLRLISQRSAVPHIDLDACTRRGVVVCSNLHAGTPSYAAAELTWALVLAASRQLPAQMASLRAGTWQAGVGHTLRGRTLGIFGYGRIGRVVASYGAAFGMTVLVWSRRESRLAAEADGHAVAEDQRDLFARSDVVSLHLRLLDATRGIVTAGDLAAMKSSAVLVNTARAGLVEPGALRAALQRGRPGGAALDVFDEEPLVAEAEPLLALDNVVGTPHIGFVTREELDLQFSDVFEQIVAFADGHPINVLNPIPNPNPRSGRPRPVHRPEEVPR